MSARSRTAQLLTAHDQHADALFRFCYAYLGDRERATDAVQETFVRTWTYLSKGNAIDRMRPFLYRTARNLLIDRSRRTPEISLDRLQGEGFDVPDEQTLDPAVSAETMRVIRCTARLDEQYRDVILLRFVEGMTPQDIAAMTGETENAISVRIHRGLKQLRILLGAK